MKRRPDRGRPIADPNAAAIMDEARRQLAQRCPGRLQHLHVQRDPLELPTPKYGPVTERRSE